MADVEGWVGLEELRTRMVMLKGAGEVKELANVLEKSRILELKCVSESNEYFVRHVRSSQAAKVVENRLQKVAQCEGVAARGVSKVALAAKAAAEVAANPCAGHDHGPYPLCPRPMGAHDVVPQMVCFDWSNQGMCPRGSACKYVHDDGYANKLAWRESNNEMGQKRECESNQMGLPMKMHKVPDPRPKGPAPAPYPSMPSKATRLFPGAPVQIKGLQKKPELNGRTGRCISFDSTSQRWQVALFGGAQLALKEECLTMI